MPRPSASPLAAACAAVALFGAAQGPAAVHAALAAAAGSIFEAAPFVLIVERIPAGRLRAFAGLAGCGCGGGLPGALSLAAVALCWLAFGPLVALARIAAGIGLALVARRRGTHQPSDGDPFATLAAVGTSAAATALLLASGRALVATSATTDLGRAAALVAGLALGAVAPCATAAVAVAAALAPHAPFAAAGVLATGGLVRVPALRGRVRSTVPERGRVLPRATLGTALARIALAATLAWLAWRGPSGFTNPRLRPVLVIGACLGIASARRAAGTTLAPAVSVVAIAALVAHSPVPTGFTNANGIADAYPGERVSFTGRAHTVDRATIVERYTITCCRADAVVEALRVARRLRVADGAWIVVRGTLAAEPDGTLALDALAWRAIPEPTDPFSYR